MLILLILSNYSVKLFQYVIYLNWKKLIRIIFETFLYTFFIYEHKYYMENLPSHSSSVPRQISCSCSLINFEYNIQKAPSKNRSVYTCSINNDNDKQNERSNKTTVARTIKANYNERRKSKVSLSRSMSRTFSNQIGQSNMIYKYQPYESSTGFETLNIYNNSRDQNLKTTFDSNASEAYKFKKRQNSFNFYDKNKVIYHRWKNDLEHTKNTTFDNSLQISQLKLTQNVYNHKRMPENYEFSFYNEKKSDQKTSNRRQRDRLAQQPLNEQNQQTSIVNFSSKASSLAGIQEQSLRRIKTLKQLDYKHAQSSGGGTSQNHMSMIVSFDDEKQEDLIGLNGLIRKNSMAKTWHQMR